MNVSKRILPLGTIYISNASCIYKSLALEEWIFRNHNFEKGGEALLLWSNTPAVVIGRHQNPYIEANIKFCEENNIKIARRHSGGGAVYHDLGNLNISFFTSQSRHCRPRNLKLLSNFFNLKFGKNLGISLNDRDDLIFESCGSKISGTAARISHGRAYHHLTLLVDVSLNILKAALNSSLRNIVNTNATRSVCAKSVGFLAQRIPLVKVDDIKKLVINVFKSQFVQICLIEFSPKKSLSDQQPFFDDVEKQFPGITDNWRLLQSENWIYDKTPKFNITLPCSTQKESVKVGVENGKILHSSHDQFPVGESFRHFLVSSIYY